MTWQKYRKWANSGNGLLKALTLASAAVAWSVHDQPAVNAATMVPAATVSTEAKTGPKQIHRWIMQLASDHYSVRHLAAKKLLAAGDAAVPEMKKALAGLTTPEMRHLLREDMDKIAHADLLRGPLITLDAKDISARQAFESVCRQAGTSPNFINQGVMPRVTIHAHAVPFWQVMQKLATMTGISPSPGYYGNPTQMTLILNGVLGKGHVVDMAGAFAIAPQSINYSRDVNFMSSGPSTTETFNIQAALLSIPGKLGPIQTQQAVVTKAVDNHGNSLLTATPGNMWYGNQMGGVTNFNIALQWPPHNPGTRISELKGYIPLIISLHKKSLTLKFKSKGVASASVDGIKVSVSNLKMQPAAPGRNAMWQFTYTISQPPGPFNPNSARQNIMNQLDQMNSGTILTAGGRTLQPGGWSGGGGFPQGMTYTVNVMGGKPAEFQMNVFTRQETLQIPIDLKNLPMP
jgi:hypothetical protein